MGRGDFWPPVAPKFGERPTRNSNFRNRSRGPPHMPNMIKIGLGVWAGPIPSLSPHLGYPFLYVCHAVPMRPLDRSRRLMAHMMQFPPRKCLLGFRWRKIMFRGKTPKNVNFGGENRRFKPNLPNVQMTISPTVVMRLTWNFNTMFGPWSRLRGWSTVTK